MNTENRIQNVSLRSLPVNLITEKVRPPCLADVSPRSLVEAGSSRRAHSAFRNCVKVLLTLSMVLLVGCGYQMVGKETHVPPGLNSISIPTFKNQTFEPGIEVQLTQGFLKE